MFLFNLIMYKIIIYDFWGYLITCNEFQTKPSLKELMHDLKLDPLLKLYHKMSNKELTKGES